MVRSIVEALAEYAKVQPDKLFLADGKVELTYLDAWKCVYGYAVHLRELTECPAGDQSAGDPACRSSLCAD